MLKHHSEKDLETFEDTLLYSKEQVKITGNRDRGLRNINTGNDRTDLNLTDRISKFKDVIKEGNIYRILWRYFIDIGLVNFPIKYKNKSIFTLESDMNRFFESKAKATIAPTEPGAKIIWHETLYIQNEQIKLNDNFRHYFETTIMSDQHSIKNLMNSLMACNLLMLILEEQLENFFSWNFISLW